MHLPTDVWGRLADLSPGYQKVIFRGRRYGLTRQDFNQGRSLKVYAAEQGGNDVISFNLYHTRKHSLLKPCEMPEEKVLTFLREMILCEKEG
jgi:hypothetical protein